MSALRTSLAKYHSWTVPTVAGAMAYLVGFGLTAVLVEVDPNRAINPQVVGSLGLFEQVGSVFYGSHFVGYSEGLTILGESGNVLFSLMMGLPVVVYLAVPVLVLGLTGFAVVHWSSGRQSSAIQAAKDGAKIAIGYAVIAVAGVFIVSFHQLFPNGGPVMRPNMGETIILMCVGYPITFGGLGGVIAVYWDELI